MIISEEAYLEHYGTPRHSGRYPWGSGGNEENTRNQTFSHRVKELREKGLSEAEIAKGMGLESTTQLRAKLSIEKNARKQADIAMAQRLKDKGYSTNALAKRMGIPEPTARNYLKAGEKANNDILIETSKMLKSQVDEKGFIDVGKGVENYLGVSSTRLDTAVAMLKEQGYEVHAVSLPQVTNPKQNTRYKVLGTPGSTQKEIWRDPTLIKTINSYSDDGGKSYTHAREPLSIHPKRVDVVYAEQGGGKADGVIYARPGVKDVDLGGVNYAQVRVKVGDGHYLKGMAVYKKDLPEGVDLQFHTSKSDTGNKLDAMKELSTDADLPFHSIVRQIVDKPGADDAKVTSVMNIVNDEGDWSKWSRTLSSQMLSKQSPMLAKSQLDMTYEQRLNDFENIKSLTNPTVRKRLLEDFAGSTDAAAVNLKAAAMPGQAVRVLLPVSSLSPTQVYAPGFTNGDRVVLIRHPHGGTFEIPELTVNNNHPESKRLLGEAKTAIGINHQVAHHLSGADFDGDTVLVIPNRSGKITVTRPLEELKNFNPHTAYPEYPGMKVMKNTQTEMGMISNLITDMTIKGASDDKLARAIKHSMVVIDAEKHKLDYRLSYNDNNIKALKDEYQRQPSGKGGAATLISRARSDYRVPEFKPRSQKKGGPVNKVTGELVYEPTGRVHWRTGKPFESKVERLTLEPDARVLSSGSTMELYYALHSNKLKALANEARLTAIKTPPSKYSSSAKKVYDSEVASLDSKLALAKSNAPLERQAQILANSTVKAKRVYDPSVDAKTEKKIRAQAIEEARNRTGANKTKIVITDKEWEAIQAGAISNSKLTEILTHANMEVVTQHARPKEEVLMTNAKTNRAKTMLASGYSRADVAQALGVSLSTLDRSTV